ncbi:adenylate kinase 9 [Menidia menidia]
MEDFVDNLIEDEAEIQRLRSKPTCFIIVGRPGVGKSTLARMVAESWKCILIDDTDLLNTHVINKTEDGLKLLEILSEGRSIPEDLILQLILSRLNSPDVEHYGYVLSCMPFLSEECLKIQEQVQLIRNFKLAPDFIINIKCADKDLVERLSGVKQHPITGQLYRKDQWKREEVYINKNKNKDQEVDDEEEQAEEEELSMTIVDQMVWVPENLPRNAFVKINVFKDTLLRPLEDYMSDHNPLYLLELNGNNASEELHLSVMSRLGSMAIKPVAVPVLLHNSDDEELPESINTEDLLRIMASKQSPATGFRWRRSRWGRTCPVALIEGEIIPGRPEFSVGFQDKLYILSSQEAYQKFVTNPRRYLLPPMPRRPCRVSIIGLPHAGKTTMCKILAEDYNAVVLDVEELCKQAVAKADQEKLDKIKKETTQAAIEKIKMKMEQDDELKLVTEDHPDVQAMVLGALEEAKQLTTSPHELYDEVLEKHIKEIEESNSDPTCITGWVLDNFPKNVFQMEALRKAGVLLDVIFCLQDTDGHHTVLRRAYEMDKGNLNKAMSRRSQDKHSPRKNLFLKQKDMVSEAKSNLETVVEETDAEQSGLTILEDYDTVKEEVVAPQDDWEFGYPEGPEMDKYKLQMQTFEGEWEQLKSGLTVTHCALEIGNKSPEKLFQEILKQMEKPFQYVAWELSALDQDEEAEDMEAEERSSDGYEAEEEEEDEGETTSKRLLGDTKHFCPVALQKLNTLLPCSDEIAAKYRERTFYFSSQDARDSFIQNPAQFAAQNKPLKPPALRIFLLGARGSGKSTHGEWLAQQLGLFHIQFREQLQMLMMAKTKKRVPLTDEGISLVDDLSDLETQIKKAMGEPENETDIESDNVNDTEQEVDLTEEEMAIRVYLSDGDQLSAQILDTVIAPYWKQEPYRSTGFILEGFPHTPEDVQYISEQQLFPDVVIFLEVDALNVQKRLLPTYLEKWREFQNNRKEKLELLSNLRKKKREEQVSRRRAELMEEQGLKETKTKFRFQMGESDDEEDEGAENMEDGIEAILEEEFPLEENPEEENEETEDVTTERLQMEIEERFGTDENRLVTVTELLSELHIPKLVINGSRKLQTIRNQLLQKIQPLTANRESLFQTCQTISYTLAHKLLLSSYKFNSSFGCWDPIQQYKERDTVHPLLWPLNNTYPLLLHQYIYFFSTKDNRSKFMLDPLRYLRQPKPTPTLPIKVVVIGPPKSGKTTVAQMFVQKYGLARLTIGSAMRMVLDKQIHTDLAVEMKKYLTQGLAVPDELAIQCLEVALMSLVCSTQGYVLDGFPITLKHAELMGSRGIIPMIVVQLELNTVEVLKRGLADKMKPNKPFIMHDSSEILLICNSNYKKEVVHIRNYFQQQYHNWIILDGLKSKWWIWKSIIKEISISMKYINIYLERRQSGKATCINRLCITPKELKRRLGEFCQYCPVCLALHHHLVDCSESAALTNAAEYKGHYYNLCGENHLEKFLSTPDQFVVSDHPNALPEPHLLPRKLTQIQVKNRFPQQVEMKGFCPVTYLDGNQRYEALVRGKIEYAVEYRDRIYICETKQKQDMFLRTPETYWEQRLPSKLPPVCEPVLLTSLPTLGYLEQGVAVAVIKAMTAVGCLKPKYPFLSIQRSALLYVGFYLKAFNHKSTDYNRRKYKRRLALFEENCALIPYLSSVMTGNYKPASKRPIDFEFKLNKFLALGASGANNVL